jgi:D-proline reductase (dithiol) PrdB
MESRMRADELSLWERTLIATYHWRRVDPLPRAVLRKPLGECRVALVTTAGLVPAGEAPFDLARLGGDSSFRVIPHDISPARLAIYHRSSAFDRAAVAADVNVALPLGPLTALATRGVIGSAAPRHLSFMGSITAPARLRNDHAPQAARILADDEVDVALLAPV